MQGVPAGFALTAIANYLIGKGASAPAVGAFDALIGMPWIIQFIWGPIIDRYQFSRMGHRKHWIIFSQILAFLTTLSLLFIKNPVAQLGTVGAIFCVHSVFASIQDASVDATAIATVPVTEQGRANAFMRAGYLLGIGLLLVQQDSLQCCTTTAFIMRQHVNLFFCSYLLFSLISLK